MTKQQALEKVRKLSERIEGAEMSLDAWKWQRAEAMAAAAAAGATQREIGKAAGISAVQIGKHLKVWAVSGTLTSRPPYSEAYDAATGFDRETAQARTDAARAKRLLGDPEQRRALVESLSEEEAIDLSRETHERIMRPHRVGAAERRAVREEQQDDPRKSIRGLAAVAIARAVLDLRKYANVVRDEHWTKREQSWLLSRLAKVEDALETARLATTDAESVDWDDELARLNETAEAMEGGM